ncbi:MAG: OmpA family protein [Thermoleophilaceae bacterium]|nr:OmpA family protein [Thermoleophilaceae bacterium]
MATNTISRKRSVRTKRSRQSVSRRRGAAARRPRRTRGVAKKVALIAGGIVVVLIVAALAVFGAAEQKVKDCCLPGDQSAQVVFDQATANAQSIPMTGALGEELRRAAADYRSIGLIGVGGDGKAVSDEVFDMTPKLENGTVLKVAARAEEATTKNLELVAQKINDTSASEPGQAMFLGLERLQLNTRVPIYIVSSLLDTADPLDMRRLGWDVSPKRVVRDLKKSGELPDLSGADITFVVRPVAGGQEQLRQPQVEYREALWSALAKASGATKVRFEYVDGTGAASTVAAPVVPIPAPPSTPVPVNPEARTCTVDTSAYFAPDSARLLDPASTKTALRDCVQQIGPDSSVTVVGHTAGSDPNNTFALNLSLKRAKAISKLLESLGVPSGHIKAVGMGNRNQPYPDPYDARNRSVVVTITN